MTGVGTTKRSLEFGSGSAALQLFNGVDAHVAIPSVGNVAISVLARASPVYWRLAASVHRVGSMHFCAISLTRMHRNLGYIFAGSQGGAPIDYG
jgi:hypothetical protein